MPLFYNSLIRLSTIDSTYKPRPIEFTNSSGQPYVKNVTLELFCPANTTKASTTNEVYWGVYIDNTNTTNGTAQKGVELFVYCDKYQNVLGNYGFTALYTSIILVIAGFVRSLFDGNLPYIPYELNPRPDNLLAICEAISTLRLR